MCGILLIVYQDDDAASAEQWVILHLFLDSIHPWHSWLVLFSCWRWSSRMKCYDVAGQTPTIRLVHKNTNLVVLVLIVWYFFLNCLPYLTYSYWWYQILPTCIFMYYQVYSSFWSFYLFYSKFTAKLIKTILWNKVGFYHLDPTSTFWHFFPVFLNWFT